MKPSIKECPVKISVNNRTEDVSALVVPYFEEDKETIFEKIDKEYNTNFQKTISYKKAPDKVEKQYNGDSLWIYLASLGKKEEFNAHKMREIAAKAIDSCISDEMVKVEFSLEGFETDIDNLIYVVTEGIALCAYRFDDLKNKKDDIKLKDVIITGIDNKKQTIVDSAVEVSKGVYLARDLVNMPPNYCNPNYMADTALEIGKITGMDVNILDMKKIEELKMGSFLAVGKGSENEPKFIIMEHNKDKKNTLPTVVLAGKGITFDTGGYNIKSTVGMKDMKGDMGGAAAVLGTMLACGLLNVDMHLVALIPVAENMISRNAFLPSDVITAMNGKTIEVTNTDAEGRLILADALVYADRYKPDAVIDIATLTGLTWRSLGGISSSIFTVDEKIENTLNKASILTDELIWKMPMYPETKELLETPFADIKNSSTAVPGIGFAAWFLKEFVSYPWVHIDMAGVTEPVRKKPYEKKGLANGWGVRLLTEFIKNWK